MSRRGPAFVHSDGAASLDGPARSYSSFGRRRADESGGDTAIAPVRCAWRRTGRSALHAQVRTIHGSRISPWDNSAWGTVTLRSRGHLQFGGGGSGPRVTYPSPERVLVATGSPWRQSISSDSLVLRSAGRKATGRRLLALSTSPESPT